MKSNLTLIAELRCRVHWLLDTCQVQLGVPWGCLGPGGFGSVFAGALHGAAFAIKFPDKCSQSLHTLSALKRALDYSACAAP